MSKLGILSLEIENFKGIGSEPVKVDFSPITLLFGPNSAGKSTVLHALNYLEDVLNDINPDAEMLSNGGDVNLGGFQTFVHKKELDRKVRIKLTIQPNDDGFEPVVEDLNVMPLINDCYVEVSIKWDTEAGRAVVDYFATGINNVQIIKLTQAYNSQIGEYAELNHFNLLHPIFKKFKNFEDTLGYTVYEDAEDEAMAWGESITNQKSPIPFGETLFSEEELEETGIVQGFADICTQLCLAPTKLARYHLERMRYIGPIRQSPPRNYTPPPTELPHRWASGLAAWDQLINEADEFYEHFDPKPVTKELVEIVSHWLSDDKLKTGYSLSVDKHYKLDSHLKDYLQRIAVDYEDLDSSSIYSILDEIDLQKAASAIKLIDERVNTKVELNDIGVGISQVVPVIVGAVTNCHILAIEQPELHLHPALQCDLADLFISRKNLSENRIHLLETHSENMMLRLQKRIRDSKENDKVPEELKLRSEEVAVYYFQATPNGSKITHLPINEEGEFEEDWPEGFFEERIEELF